jgi:energy-coupling factor transporter ATP-binding protein EcfA2
MGAATVVDPTGKVMPDKYQSFMRGMMRATAEATGRDPHIAESMVDTANVLSLTSSEAIEAGYCNAVAENVEEVITHVIGENEYIIKEMEDDLTWLDKLISLLLNPLLQSIFMMMIVGGIFVEIRTPGIGLPLVTAIVGALLYFAPLYVEQLAASWEILLFVIGLILVALEVFVFPGFGVAGISGIVAIVLALSFAMIDNADFFTFDGSFTLTPLLRPVAIVVFSVTIAVFGSVWLIRKLLTTRSFDGIALHEEMKARRDIRVFYMPQDPCEMLDMDKTPVEMLALTWDKEETTQSRVELGSMKFTPEEMDHPCRGLSGGQKIKLMFLMMARKRPDVLLLDEPTRNLSPLSGPVVRELFASYPGCIIAVSHDRLFARAVFTRAVELTPTGLHDSTLFDS